MLKASKQQKQRIAILTKGDKEYKAALVEQITKDATKTSTNDLSHAQANQLIAHLGGTPILYDNWAYFDASKASHRNILSLAIQIGWRTTNQHGRDIADLGRLSEWLKSKKAPVSKKLNDMNANEISKTITALEGILKSRYK